MSKIVDNILINSIIYHLVLILSISAVFFLCTLNKCNQIELLFVILLGIDIYNISVSRNLDVSHFSPYPLSHNRIFFNLYYRHLVFKGKLIYVFIALFCYYLILIDNMQNVFTQIISPLLILLIYNLWTVLMFTLVMRKKSYSLLLKNINLVILIFLLSGGTAILKKHINISTTNNEVLLINLASLFILYPLIQYFIFKISEKLPFYNQQIIDKYNRGKF